MNDENRGLEELGYDDFFESSRQDLGFKDYPPARVIAEYRGAYKVRASTGEFIAKVTGRQMHQAASREDFPAVGDWVAIEAIPNGEAIVRGILTRKNVLKKNNKQNNKIIATNIDIAFITEAMDRDYNLNRLERYMILTEQGNITPVIILNKTDLISESELLARTDEIKNRLHNVSVIPTSIVKEQGLKDLEGIIEKGITYCFLGSSGVGKSSLINCLLGKDEIKTREISVSMGRGMHTTTSREIYFLKNGGIVIDNPGIREVEVADSGAGIDNVFEEITFLSQRCRYSDCSHIQEPGCAISQAIEDGKLDEKQYHNYIKLKKESAFHEMTDLEKRKKDRKFGQFIKKYQDRQKDED